MKISNFIDYEESSILDKSHVNYEISDFNQNKNNNTYLYDKFESSFIEHQNEFNNEFSIHNRRYLGNKHKLSEFICWVVENNCQHLESVADVFAGTGTIANLFNICNKQVIVNDLLYSNYLIYSAFFSDEVIDLAKLNEMIDEYNIEYPKEGNYFSDNFGNSFFTEDNARKIGFIREKIENESTYLNMREKSILISSLMYATDKIANTCGHYDAYRRSLDSTNELNLLFPNLKDSQNNEGNEIHRMDANKLVKKISPDLVYIDPPYNSRQYGDTYHLLENLAEWKKPEVFGIAKKMKDRKKVKSKYCTVKAPSAFENLIDNIDSRYILVSYNNMAQKGSGRSNAKISSEEIFEILMSKGDLKIFSSDYKAFTTGKTDISGHKELLYLIETY
ncbi:MAG: DNA adenine methylase [Methanobacteriaceae archaeon]